MLEAAYGREMNIPFSGNSSGRHSCSKHNNCTLPQNSPFIVPSTRCMFVTIMPFNQLLGMPHLSGGWIILTKVQMLSNRDVNRLVVLMEHCLDLLFQLKKHGTNTLHVAFRYFFTVNGGFAVFVC